MKKKLTISNYIDKIAKRSYFTQSFDELLGRWLIIFLLTQTLFCQSQITSMLNRGYQTLLDINFRKLVSQHLHQENTKAKDVHLWRLEGWSIDLRSCIDWATWTYCLKACEHID